MMKRKNTYVLKKRYTAFLVVAAFLVCLPYHAAAQLLDSLALDTIHEYTSLEEAQKNPDKVIKLVLKRSKLKQIPSAVFDFVNLQYLDLSKNQISELPQDIAKLSKLQVLVLSRNRIESLPGQIGLLKNLKTLNVNQNELISLPPQIGQLENLTVLDLWSNNITTFPDELKELKKLKRLDLRVILLNDEEQKKIQLLLPHTQIFFSPSCRCGP